METLLCTSPTSNLDSPPCMALMAEDGPGLGKRDFDAISATSIPKSLFGEYKDKLSRKLFLNVNANSHLLLAKRFSKPKAFTNEQTNDCARSYATCLPASSHRKQDENLGKPLFRGIDFSSVSSMVTQFERQCFGELKADRAKTVTEANRFLLSVLREHLTEPGRQSTEERSGKLNSIDMSIALCRLSSKTVHMHKDEFVQHVRRSIAPLEPESILKKGASYQFLVDKLQPVSKKPRKSCGSTCQETQSRSRLSSFSKE